MTDCAVALGAAVLQVKMNMSVIRRMIGDSLIMVSATDPDPDPEADQSTVRRQLSLRGASRAFMGGEIMSD